jgi:hypothetical protein
MASPRLHQPTDICVCQTDFDGDVTTLCVRVEDDEAALAQEWAERLGVDRHELLRHALRCHLAVLAASEG